MSSKTSVRRIVIDHIGTFKSGFGLAWWDYIVFFGLPFISALVLAFFKWLPPDPMKEGLLNALAIFAGLLLNLLVLFHGLIRKNTATEKAEENPQSQTPIADELRQQNQVTFSEVLKETYYNTAYAVLIVLLAIVFLLLLSAGLPVWIQTPIAACLYFLLGNFLLTLFMILKRMHSLLSLDFKESDTL